MSGNRSLEEIIKGFEIRFDRKPKGFSPRQKKLILILTDEEYQEILDVMSHAVHMMLSDYKEEEPVLVGGYKFMGRVSYFYIYVKA